LPQPPDADHRRDHRSDDQLRHDRDHHRDDRRLLAQIHAGTYRQVAQIHLVDAQRERRRRRDTADERNVADDAADRQDRRGGQRQRVEHFVLRAGAALRAADVVDQQPVDEEAQQRQHQDCHAADHADRDACHATTGDQCTDRTEHDRHDCGGGGGDADIGERLALTTVALVALERLDCRLRQNCDALLYHRADGSRLNRHVVPLSAATADP